MNEEARDTEKAMQAEDYLDMVRREIYVLRRQVVAAHEEADTLREIIETLRNLDPLLVEGVLVIPKGRKDNVT